MSFLKKNIKYLLFFILIVCFLLVLLFTKKEDKFHYIGNLYTFKDGVAVVRDNDKYSLIDTKGNIISKIDCDEIVSIFDEGYIFGKDNKYGLINKAGEVIIEAKYDYISDFSEGLAAFDQIDKNGNTVVGVINNKGEVVIEAKYDYIGSFKEGLAIFSQSVENGDYMYGVINSKGEVVVEAKYDSINDFVEGLAIFEKSNENEGSKYGVINSKGEVVVEAKYDYISDFSKGVAVFEEIYKIEIIESTPDSEVSQKYSKYGIINAKGEVVVEAKYSYISDFSEEVAVFIENKDDIYLYGVINAKGEVIIEPKYACISDFSEGMAIFTEFNDSTLDKYTNEGKENYGLLEAISELEAIEENNTGVIDKNGNIIIEPKYSEILGFENGLSVFAKYINESKVYGIIDINGNEVIEGKYEDMYSLGEDFYCFIKNGKYGVIDSKGNIIVDAKYDYIDSFNDGIAYVGMYKAKGMKIGYIDNTGKEIIPIKYNSKLLLDYELRTIGC